MRKHTLFCLLLLASCKHAGVGEGELTMPPATSGAEGAPEGKVDFTWRSGFDASDGQIQATLPNARAYSGNYLQIRAKMDTNTLGTYFVAWSSPKWAGDPWYGGPPEHFAGENTGRVVALLKSADGSQMRCKFELRKPDSGMAGGGSGQCQLSDKEEIFGAALRETRHHGL